VRNVLFAIRMCVAYYFAQYSCLQYKDVYLLITSRSTLVKETQMQTIHNHVNFVHCNTTYSLLVVLLKASSLFLVYDDWQVIVYGVKSERSYSAVILQCALFCRIHPSFHKHISTVTTTSIVIRVWLPIIVMKYVFLIWCEHGELNITIPWSLYNCSKIKKLIPTSTKQLQNISKGIYANSCTCTALHSIILNKDTRVWWFMQYIYNNLQVKFYL